MTDFSPHKKAKEDVTHRQVCEALSTGMDDRESERDWAKMILRIATPEQIRDAQNALHKNDLGSFREDFYGL